jgi:hypothetical protein
MSKVLILTAMSLAAAASAFVPTPEPEEKTAKPKFLSTFAVVAAATPAEIPNGHNDENLVAFQAALANDVTAGSDTITVQLPARWRGTGFTVVAVRYEKWTTGAPTAAGARTKTNIPIVVTSFVESTGVITLTPSTTNLSVATESGRVILLIAPSA